MPTDRRYQLLMIGFEHPNLRNTFIKHMANKFDYTSAGGSIARMLNSAYQGIIIDSTHKVMDVATTYKPKTVLDKDQLCAVLILEHEALVQFISDMDTTIIDMGPIDE